MEKRQNNYIRIGEDFIRVTNPAELCDDRVIEKPYSISEVFEYLLNRGSAAV